MKEDTDGRAVLYIIPEVAFHSVCNILSVTIRFMGSTQQTQEEGINQKHEYLPGDGIIETPLGTI